MVSSEEPEEPLNRLWPLRVIFVMPHDWDECLEAGDSCVCHNPACGDSWIGNSEVCPAETGDRPRDELPEKYKDLKNCTAKTQPMK